MQHTLSQKAHKMLSVVTLTALVLGMLSFSFAGSIPMAAAAPGNPVVTITKYVDGVQATSGNAMDADFQMSATWNDPTGIGAGTGTYALSETNTVPYEAMTMAFQSGADYATNEIMDGVVVGAACGTGASFELVGYTYGDTLAEAQGMTPTMTSPSFVGMTDDKYVIVWNHDCAISESVEVTINKYVDGVQATAVNTDNADFTMTSTTTATNINGGTESSGNYQLNAGNAYQAMTSTMDSGADYATEEVMDGATVGASCTGGQLYGLVGYTTGDTHAQAQMATPTMTKPSFTGLTSDKYVIVWNHDCSESEGTIGGDVTGGQGALAVSSVDAVDTTATADGTYENGWEYTFNITVPTNETGIAMKFSNWTSGSSTMAVANNMRISSAQADNGGATVNVVAANTYTTPDLNMTGDLDPLTAGLQVQITVEVRIPSGTTNGSYTTSYGVRSQ